MWRITFYVAFVEWLSGIIEADWLQYRKRVMNAAEHDLTILFDDRILIHILFATRNDLLKHNIYALCESSENDREPFQLSSVFVS